MVKNHNDKLQPLVIAKICSIQTANPRRRKNASKKLPPRYGAAGRGSLMLTRFK